MNLAKVSTVIAVAIGVIALLGYAFDAGDYYQPKAEATEQHAAAKDLATEQHAVAATFNELDHIAARVAVLELQIARITDMATLQERPLTPTEEAMCESLRVEIRMNNERRNAILAGRKT